MAARENCDTSNHVVKNVERITTSFSDDIDFGCYTCAICLEIFKHPMKISCGHMWVQITHLLSYLCWFAMTATRHKNNNEQQLTTRADHASSFIILHSSYPFCHLVYFTNFSIWFIMPFFPFNIADTVTVVSNHILTLLPLIVHCVDNNLIPSVDRKIWRRKSPQSKLHVEDVPKR